MTSSKIAFGALSALLLTSCSGGASGAYVLGALGPLTGDASSYGVEMQRAAELALEDINAAWEEKGMYKAVDFDKRQKKYFLFEFLTGLLLKFFGNFELF